MDTSALSLGESNRMTRRRMRRRDTIERLEVAVHQAIDSGEQEQTIFDGETKEGHDQCKHYFGDGVYARSLFIPAGTTVIGKIHRRARICIIAQGKCQFVDEFQKKQIEAPWIGEFQAGSKTAVYAETDTLWIAIVGTDMKNPLEILSKLSASTFNEYEQIEHDEIRRLK